MLRLMEPAKTTSWKHRHSEISVHWISAFVWRYGILWWLWTIAWICYFGDLFLFCRANHQSVEYFYLYFFSDDVKADVVLLPLSNFNFMNNKSLVMLNCVSWTSHCEWRMVGWSLQDFGTMSRATGPFPGTGHHTLRWSKGWKSWTSTKPQKRVNACSVEWFIYFLMMNWTAQIPPSDLSLGTKEILSQNRPTLVRSTNKLMKQKSGWSNWSKELCKRSPLSTVFF